MEQTTRKIIETAVSGLKREFLSPQEKAKLVDYILSNSTLQVSKTSFNLESASLVGIGKEQSETALPIFQYLTFYWGNLDSEENRTDDLPTREWFLTSHQSLDDMEHLLLARTELPGEQNNLTDGEVVAIINGKVEAYTVDNIDIKGKYGLQQSFINWVDIEPYLITYKDKEGIVSLEESYGSQVQAEFRVLQLLTDGAKNVHIRDTLTNEDMPFIVTETTYDSKNPHKPKEKRLVWQPSWGIPGEDEVF